MGLFNKSKQPSAGGSGGKSWIPEAIEFELGNNNNNNNSGEDDDGHNESASALGASNASNLGASLSSAFLLEGDDYNSRRIPLLFFNSHHALKEPPWIL